MPRRFSASRPDGRFLMIVVEATGVCLVVAPSWRTELKSLRLAEDLLPRVSPFDQRALKLLDRFATSPYGFRDRGPVPDTSIGIVASSGGDTGPMSPCRISSRIGPTSSGVNSKS
jgi:hypothetical protein